jgi:hypothetical protein
MSSKYIDTGKYNRTLSLNYFPTITLVVQIEPLLLILFRKRITKKDADQEKNWLIISALSDLKLAKKEYISTLFRLYNV